jgi:hypothetical protein
MFVRRGQFVSHSLQPEAALMDDGVLSQNAAKIRGEASVYRLLKAHDLTPARPMW